MVQWWLRFTVQNIYAPCNSGWRRYEGGNDSSTNDIQWSHWKGGWLHACTATGLIKFLIVCHKAYTGFLDSGGTTMLQTMEGEHVVCSADRFYRYDQSGICCGELVAQGPTVVRRPCAIDRTCMIAMCCTRLALNGMVMRFA